MGVNSRGSCITAYNQAFARGAKVFPAQMSGFITGVTSGGITKEYLGKNAVRTEKISAGAVTTVKILSANVTKEKIGANAVRTEKISAGAVTKIKMRCAYLTGTVSANIGAFPLAHGLGAVPAIVMVSRRGTSASMVSATNVAVGQSSVSANTSAIVYLAASKAGVGFAAYIQI
jgi:hypothetical protein